MSKKTAGRDADPGLRAILGGTEIPTAYKIGYVLNFYREPSFRAIEMEFGLTRPEIVILLALHFREGITASEFCEFSGHLKAGVSRAVIVLEKKGLIRRQTDKLDNRRRLLVHDRCRTGSVSALHPNAAREREGDAGVPVEGRAPSARPAARQAGRSRAELGQGVGIIAGTEWVSEARPDLELRSGT
jgi:hypothetical protein